MLECRIVTRIQVMPATVAERDDDDDDECDKSEKRRSQELGNEECG